MARVTQAEYAWREWFLGEVRFKGHARDPALRAKTGAPARIPEAWWQRLEAFLTRRNDYAEPGRHSDGTHPPAAAERPVKLSAHLLLAEFDCHDGRQVPLFAVPALRRLAKQLIEPMRSTFGPVHILSGYRPADYNARVGGAKFSQHIYELTPESVAADLVFRTGNVAEWARLADQLGAGGLGRYDSSGFVHVDNRPNRARWTG